MRYHNNIVVTGANSPYFETLLTLISSIHKNTFDFVDGIFVYDLGLSDTEILRLQSIEKVFIKEIPKNLRDQYPHINDPKKHFDKLFCLYDAMSYAWNVFWLDAGVMCLKDIEHIFHILDKDHIFCVTDVHLNKNYTHKKCVEIMKATESELLDKQLSSGIFGFKSDGRYRSLIEEAFEYGKLECTVGDEENHRHDQSVLSILVSRHNCPRHDIDIYGYWTDYNRNLQTAKEIGAVIFVHRRGHHDVKDLRYVQV